MSQAKLLMGLGCPECGGECNSSMNGLGSTYYPNTGDVVNVLKDIVGKKADGKGYVIKAGSFFTPNVVMIETASVGKNYLKINDGTDNSPIMATYLDNKDSFEMANFINQKLFAPYSGTAKVLTKVASAAGDTVESAADAVSSTAKVASYLIPLAVTGLALGGGYYIYKHYIKGNEKIKAPKVSVL